MKIAKSCERRSGSGFLCRCLAIRLSATVCLIVAVVILSARAGAESQPPPLDRAMPRMPRPDAASQARIERTIRELFKNEYGKKSKADSVALSKLLRIQAQQNANDPTARYVLLRESRDAAARGEDLQTAFDVIDEMDRIYLIDIISEKFFRPQGRLEEDCGIPRRQAILLKWPCLSAAMPQMPQNGDVAVQSAELAEAAGRGTTDASRAAIIRNALTDATAIRQEIAARIERHRAPENKVLKIRRITLPLVGFFALLRTDWDNGLPHLAKCSESRIEECRPERFE